MSFLAKTWNTGNLLVAIGFVLLALTFVWPWVSSHRVARVEGWAEDISQDLLRTAIDARPLDLRDPSTGEQLLAKLSDRRHAERLRVVTSIDDLPAGVYFEGKHYYYLVTETPLDQASGPDERVEVYAWPRALLGPSRTAFFFAQSELSTYSRNLRRRYTGLERVPVAGGGRPDRDRDEQTWYRGEDEERWIDLPDRS